MSFWQTILMFCLFFSFGLYGLFSKPDEFVKGTSQEGLKESLAVIYLMISGIIVLYFFIEVL